MVLPSRSAPVTPGRAVTIALLVTLATFLPPYLVAAHAVAIQRDLGLEARDLGMAFAMSFAVSGITSVWGGRLVDGYGWRRSTHLASMMVLASTLALAVMPPRFPILLALMALSGASGSLGMPAGNLVLAQEVPIHRQGLLFGIKQSAGPAAALLAGLSVPIVGLVVGWRWAFVLGAALPVLTFPLVPRELATRSVVRQRSEPVSLRPLLVLAIGGTLAAAVIGALNSFLMLSLVNTGVSEATAGFVIALASGLGIASRLALGWLSDRRGDNGFRAVGAALLCGTLGFVLLATSQPGAAALGAMLGYGAGWAWPGLFQFGIVRHHPRAPGSATGIVRTGLAGGAALGPFLFGLLVGPFGYATSWLWTGAVGLGAAILVLMGARRLENALPLTPGPAVGAGTP